MPYATAGATPRNIGTQCENIEVENQNTVRTSLGVHTSDPLLKVVEWIAELTEVSSFHMRDVVVTSFFTQIGPIVVWAVVLILYFLLYVPNVTWHLVDANLGFATFVFFAISFTGGLMGWCYLHFLWVKPSRHLVLGIQQVSTSQAFLKKSFKKQPIKMCPL